MSESRVAVYEQYVKYQPPADFRRIVDRLLATVPPKYLTGLSCIVLTNFSGQPRRLRGKVRQAGRKYDASDVQGQYFKAIKGERAWIRIYVDNIIWPKRLRWLPPFQDFVVADVLYHEIGHHAHRLQPEYRAKEEVADDWRGRLYRNHVRTRYRLVLPFLWIVVKARSAINRFGKRKTSIAKRFQ